MGPFGVSVKLMAMQAVQLKGAANPHETRALPFQEMFPIWVKAIV
jgi:hypothetical protein